MRELVYDIAISTDGFIAGPDLDISQFLYEGDHVAPYTQRLTTYDAVVMGRRTYTSGYAFGLQPGQRAYPHMEHWIISRTLELPDDRQVQLVRTDAIRVIRDLKATEGGDIYLCGGGDLAGQLLDAGLIDRLILKINPILLGSGTPLFGGASRQGAMRLLSTEAYDSGVTLVKYSLT